VDADNMADPEAVLAGDSFGVDASFMQ